MPKPRSFTQQDLTIQQEHTPYQGFASLKTYKLTHRLFSGSTSPVITRELLQRPPVVGILPVDFSQQQLVLIEQFRIGALQDNQSPWLLEIVAGVIDDGEQPETSAARETQEEAGLAISNLQLIQHYWVSPGYSTENMRIYCGEVKTEQAAQIAGLDSEDEDIRVHVVSFQQAWQWLDNGFINNAPSIIALQWLRLNQN